MLCIILFSRLLGNLSSYQLPVARKLPHSVSLCRFDLMLNDLTIYLVFGLIIFLEDADCPFYITNCYN